MRMGGGKTKPYQTVGVDGLSRDGAGQISRDARTKRIQTLGMRLAEPNHTVNVPLSMPTGLIYTFVYAREFVHQRFQISLS